MRGEVGKERKHKSLGAKSAVFGIFILRQAPASGPVQIPSDLALLPPHCIQRATQGYVGRMAISIRKFGAGAAGCLNKLEAGRIGPWARGS